MAGESGFDGAVSTDCTGSDTGSGVSSLWPGSVAETVRETASGSSGIGAPVVACTSVARIGDFEAFMEKIPHVDAPIAIIATMATGTGRRRPLKKDGGRLSAL